MNNVHSYEDCQPIIEQAFDIAIKYLKENLGDSYTTDKTRLAWSNFQNCVESDIKFEMLCPVCKEVKSEDSFMTLDSTTYCCGSCFENAVGEI